VSGRFPIHEEQTSTDIFDKIPRMSKGRTKSSQAGIGSTRRKDISMVTHHIPTKANPHLDIEQQYIAPVDVNVIPQDHIDAVNNKFCFAALAEKT
jgi:hypothetical protein